MAGGGCAADLRVGLGLVGEGGMIPMGDGKGSMVPAFPSSPLSLQGLGQTLSVSQACASFQPPLLSHCWGSELRPGAQCSPALPPAPCPLPTYSQSSVPAVAIWLDLPPNSPFPPPTRPLHVGLSLYQPALTIP